MNFIYFSTFITVPLIHLSINIVKGGNILSKKEIQQICSEINRRSSLHLPKEEVEKKFEKKIIHKINELQHRQAEQKANGFKNENQVVKLLTDNTVGKNGELVQMTLVGTGSSTGNHLEPVFKEQADNDFKDSEILLTTLFVNPVADMRKRNHEPHEQNFKIGGNNLSLLECTKLAHLINNRQLRCLESNKRGDSLLNAHGNIPQSGNLSPKKLISDNGSNSTLIDTRLKLGPGGANAYYIGIERDQANNQAIIPITDIQDNGNYDNSKIELLDVEVFTATK